MTRPSGAEALALVLVPLRYVGPAMAETESGEMAVRGCAGGWPRNDLYAPAHPTVPLEIAVAGALG